MSENNKCICNSISFKEYNKYSQKLGHNVEYHQCESCGLVTAPESAKYHLNKIYNIDYFKYVDYGWKGRAKILLIYIKYINALTRLKRMQICDFGSGNGYLSKLLINNGFNVLAYEPFIQNETYLEKSYYCNSPFDADVLLMVEVFEHFTDAFEINKILKDFHKPRLVIFTTNLIDNAKVPISEWFYLEPDSGHFTLWSKKSLSLFAEMNGYRLISFDTFLHIFCRTSDIEMYNNLKILSIPAKAFMRMRSLYKRLLQ